MKITCTIMLFVSAALAHAGTGGDITDGNSLQDNLGIYKRYAAGAKLKTDEIVDAFNTLGYIRGFVGGSEPWYQIDKTACPYELPRMPLTQLIQVVDKYLADHPEQLHESASAVMFLAITKAFPNPAYRREKDPGNDRAEGPKM